MCRALGGRSTTWLHGRAHRIALQLRVPRPDGTFDQGDSALVRLAVDEVRDPINPNQILQAHIPSGVQCLCNALRDAFGQSDQDMASSSLDRFFECRRRKMSFQEYAVEWDMRLEEAADRAGLHINEVAKIYLFFKSSGLPPKMIDDLKMQMPDPWLFASATRVMHRAMCSTTRTTTRSRHTRMRIGTARSGTIPWSGSVRTTTRRTRTSTTSTKMTATMRTTMSTMTNPRWTLRRYRRRRNQVENNRPMLQRTRRNHEEYYGQQKGKGRSCYTICGSRYHISTERPMNKGKGKGGKSKGKGKGTKGGYKQNGYKGGFKGGYQGGKGHGGYHGGKGHGGFGKGRYGYFREKATMRLPWERISSGTRRRKVWTFRMSS